MCQWIKDVWSAREKERDQLVGIGRHHATRHESRPSSSPVSCPSLVPSPDAIATYTGLYQWHSSVVLFIQPRVLLFYLFFFSFSPLILILPRCCCDLIASDWQQPKKKFLFFSFSVFYLFYSPIWERSTEHGNYQRIHSTLELKHMYLFLLSLSRRFCAGDGISVSLKCVTRRIEGERDGDFCQLFFSFLQSFLTWRKEQRIYPLWAFVYGNTFTTHTHTRLLMRKRIHSRPPALSLSRVHFSKSAKWPSGNLLLLLDCCCWMVWLRVCCKWDPVIDDDGERRYSTGSDEDETRKHHRRKEGGWKQELLS